MKKFISVLLICFLFITPALADSYSELIEKAVTYTANGDTQKAIASYQLAQRVDPKKEEAFLKEAECHLNSENFSEATRCINSVLDLNPVSPDAWIMKCNIDIALDDLTSLEEDILFAEVCDADLSPIYPGIGMLYYARGQYKDAAHYFSVSDFSSFDESTTAG